MILVSLKYVSFIITCNSSNLFVYNFSDINDEDSDESEIKVEKKQVKKKNRLKDETEQPVYPCDNCIQCFTTQRDLKVHKYFL